MKRLDQHAPRNFIVVVQKAKTAFLFLNVSGVLMSAALVTMIPKFVFKYIQKGMSSSAVDSMTPASNFVSAFPKPRDIF